MGRLLAAFILLLLVFAAALSSASGGPQRSAIHFVDIARQAGLNARNTYGGVGRKDYILETTGNGVAIFDYDGDGRNDLLFVNGTTLDGHGNRPPATLQLYHNDGNGHFTNVSQRAGFHTEGWGAGVCVGDYDNDGHPDVLITYYGHNVLYRNRGDGTFEDVTRKAGLPVTGTRYGTGCSFLDYDRDGKLDIFISNYVALDLAKTPMPGDNQNCLWKGIRVMCGPRGLPPGRNILYHNNGDGTFTDVSEKAGILKPGGRYGLGVAVADFDNDGWPDIYVACDQTPSLLYRNRGDGTFEERGAEAGVAYNFDGQLQAGMGVAVADYDGAGFFDIVKTNFSGDLPSLYKNEDGRFFSDVSQRAALGRNLLLGWGVAFVDVDEDGWKDLVIANGHVYPEVDGARLGETYREKTLLYRNLGDGRFADVTGQAGPAFEPLRPARGLAVGDLEGDGHPEIVILNMNEAPSLLRNEGTHGNAVIVELAGTKSNRSAIGARVILETGGRRQMDEVRSGGSYLSQNELALHFGLGTATLIDRLEVQWPSGTIQKWKRLPVNERLTITEGATQFRSRRFK